VNPLDTSELERVVADRPNWLHDLRRQSLAVFDKLSMPKSEEEMWRYVDLDFELADYQSPGDSGRAAAPANDELGAALGEATALVEIVDGLAEVRSQSGEVAVASLRDLTADTEPVARRLMGAGVTDDTDIFAAAHGSFSPDAVVIHAPPRSVTREPVFVDVAAVADRGVTFPHVIVDAAQSSQLSVVIGYRSADDIDAVVVPRLEVTAGTNANVDVTVIQHWGAATRSVAHARAVAANDASVTLAEAGLGGMLSRLHLEVDLEGKGSNANVVGAYFGELRQILDYRYFMRHIGENTTSNMYLKGGVEDEALSVFTGMIRIEESAQRTNAFQTNRNLLLSDGAAAQSVPNLEILANDVKCGHGSTVGPLDEEQRYYLMSRGLDRRRADRLQVRGFFQDALNRFPVGVIAEPVQGWIDTKYVAAQQEGRV
jgi:Fe-S cluster assembly protein SufD